MALRRAHWLGLSLVPLLLAAPGCGGGSSSGSGTPALAAPAIAYTPPSRTLTRGVPSTIAAPASTGGAVATWSVSPDLPAGLALGTAGAVAGTATVLAPQAAYTVTARNAAGTGTAVLTLAVVDPVPAIAYAPSTLTFTRGAAIAPLTPQNTGGPVVSWTVAPALPAGLGLDPATGVLRGTPTALSVAAPYTVTATNSGGAAAAVLTLAVQDGPPTVAYSPATATLYAGLPMAPILPLMGGGTALSFSVAPAPPAGVAFDAATGAFTGTPAAPGPAVLYTVTASNAGGNGSATLTLRVNGPDATLQADAFHTAGSRGRTATVPVQPGATITWTVRNGSIEAGQGTRTLTYAAGAVGSLDLGCTVAFGGRSATGQATVTVVAAPRAEVFAQARLHPGSVNLRASVEPQAGTTVAWSVLAGSAQGVLLAGAATPTAVYGAGPATGTFSLRATVQNQAGDTATGTFPVQVVAGAFVGRGGGPQPRAGTVTALPSGRVLVTGGSTDYDFVLDSELYDPYTDTWRTTGRPARPRDGHAATLLAGGRVLVTGGYGPGGVQASAEVFDPAADAWAPAASLRTARTGHTATLLADGRVLVAGGLGADGPLASAELYDPALDAWTALPDLATARQTHTATLLPDGTVLVVGGCNATYAPLGSAERFDPAARTWRAVAPVYGARYVHSATLLRDGRLFLAGGLGPEGSLASTVLFDPAAGAWTWGPELSADRYSHTATLLPDGRVLVAGGLGLGGYLDGADLIDAATQTRRSAASLRLARGFHGAALLPTGRVLVTGGNDSSGVSGNAEAYDPAANAWVLAGSQGQGRALHTATVLATGQVLVTGGQNGVQPLAGSSLYDPAANTWSATASLGAARFGHSATLLADGTVLVAGGTDGLAGTLPAEVFDPATRRWTTAGVPEPTPMFHTATRLRNGKVLVVGGVSPSGAALAQAWLYDPAQRTWTGAGSLAAPRCYHAAVLLPDGRVLVAGGMGDLGPWAKPLATTEVFDPANGSWTRAADLAEGRYLLWATLLPSGRVLVAGGMGADTTLASVERYDPASNTWAPGPAMAAPRYGQDGALLPDGRVLVVGGWSLLTADLGSAELLDAGGTAWTRTGGLALWRDWATTTLLPDGTVMVYGGSPSMACPEFWK